MVFSKMVYSRDFQKWNSHRSTNIDKEPCATADLQTEGLLQQLPEGPHRPGRAKCP